MELSASDLVNIGLTEAILSDRGPPLFVAASLGCIAAVKVMAEAGSNLEVRGPGGQRPLHAAAAAGHAGIAGILLSAGCEIDPLDDDGFKARIRATTLQLRQLAREIVATATAAHADLDAGPVLALLGDAPDVPAPGMLFDSAA